MIDRNKSALLSILDELAESLDNTRLTLANESEEDKWETALHHLAETLDMSVKKLEVFK